jgi:hypothetical protein
MQRIFFLGRALARLRIAGDELMLDDTIREMIRVQCSLSGMSATEADAFSRLPLALTYPLHGLPENVSFAACGAFVTRDRRLIPGKRLGPLPAEILRSMSAQP